jgi:hypothetical protein
MAIFDSDEPKDGESVENEETAEPDEQDKRNFRAFVVVLLLELPLIIFPFFSERPEFSIGIGMCAVANVMAFLKCGELWNRIWFWIVVVFIQGSSAALAVFAHWPRVMITRLTLIPIGIGYFMLTVGIVTFLDKFIFKSNALGEE